MLLEDILLELMGLSLIKDIVAHSWIIKIIVNLSFENNIAYIF